MDLTTMNDPVPLHEWLSIHPLEWSGVAAAIVCGSIVGLERQIRGKPVGIRTSSLIVLGTYVFITIATFAANDMMDSSRIIGQVVTGIGFLGAGVMLAREGMVVGVTSAATIWALAAVGTVIPLASEASAVKLSLVIVGILYGVDLLEDYSSALTRGVHTRYNGWKRQSRRGEKAPLSPLGMWNNQTSQSTTAGDTDEKEQARG